MDNNSVSRRHAEIHRITNGVYINQLKTHKAILQEADIIEVRDILLRFTFISEDDLPDDATAMQHTKVP